MADSLSVAEVFGKEHKNVLERIRQIDKENQVVNLLSFKPIKYVDSRGREQDAFEMTEDGFMGVVGKFERDGKQWTTSLNVAEVFGKNHYHVIEAIENLDCSQEFRESNFRLSSYVTSQNKELKMYEMTRDGFTFLVMGYIGKPAAQFKEAYIEAFNRMDYFDIAVLSEPLQNGHVAT